MPKKNKNKKQAEPASEESAREEVAQTKPDVPPSPSPKENQIEPVTPQRPKAMPEEEPETEEAREVPAQTPPRQLVAVAEIPKAPAGTCAVCRGKSNVALQDRQMVEGREIAAVYLCRQCIDEQPSSKDWKVWSHWMESKV